MSIVSRMRPEIDELYPKKDKKEEIYIRKRLAKAAFQSLPFYLFRVFPIKKKKIVVTTIEGQTGFSCNPKYIVKELLRRKAGYEIVWLVNDPAKKFPKQVKGVKNTLLNRAFHLTTAHFWIDNSRKQLEVRKRKGQIYIQTWHAKLGFKATALDRIDTFPKIAYIVSRHDSEMTDYAISNSRWYDDTLPTGMIYKGKVLRTGSPRLDILVNRTKENALKVKEKLGIPETAKILMYCPTFRGGSQKTERSLDSFDNAPDYDKLIASLEGRFGGEWFVLLRLHPQLVARSMEAHTDNERLVDISTVDDMYEYLPACDAFMTDYSSAAFDAAVMGIPVFIYADDLDDYIKNTGKLLFDLKRLPFPFAADDSELSSVIGSFDSSKYRKELDDFFEKLQMVEDGHASERLADLIQGA